MGGAHAVVAMRAPPRNQTGIFDRDGLIDRHQLTKGQRSWAGHKQDLIYAARYLAALEGRLLAVRQQLRRATVFVLETVDLIGLASGPERPRLTAERHSQKRAAFPGLGTGPVKGMTFDNGSASHQWVVRWESQVSRLVPRVLGTRTHAELERSVRYF